MRAELKCNAIGDHEEATRAPPLTASTTGAPDTFCHDAANIDKEWVRSSFQFTTLYTTEHNWLSIQDYNHYE